MPSDRIERTTSRSPQGSVDRNSDDLTDRLMVDVAPRRGAWIEINTYVFELIKLMVAPRRGAWIEISSLYRQIRLRVVAPRRGAWIEIWAVVVALYRLVSRSPQGSVDRNGFDGYFSSTYYSRSPQGSVDRNVDHPEYVAGTMVAPRRGAWIEIGFARSLFRHHARRSPQGSVDRNK